MNTVLTDAVLPLSVNLGSECLWLNEWEWTPVPQKVRYAVDGTLVIETISPHAAGQPIELFCSWQIKNTVVNLIALRDRVNQAVMSLTLSDGRIKQVVFDHEKNPVEVVPVKEVSDEAYTNTDKFYVTMRLLII